eukprot:jgi/Chlat1/6843/Chrsp51S06529
MTNGTHRGEGGEQAHLPQQAGMQHSAVPGTWMFVPSLPSAVPTAPLTAGPTGSVPAYQYGYAMPQAYPPMYMPPMYSPPPPPPPAAASQQPAVPAGWPQLDGHLVEIRALLHRLVDAQERRPAAESQHSSGSASTTTNSQSVASMLQQVLDNQQRQNRRLDQIQDMVQRLADSSQRQSHAYASVNHSRRAASLSRTTTTHTRPATETTDGSSDNTDSEPQPQQQQQPQQAQQTFGITLLRPTGSDGPPIVLFHPAGHLRAGAPPAMLTRTPSRPMPLALPEPASRHPSHSPSGPVPSENRTFFIPNLQSLIPQPIAAPSEAAPEGPDIELFIMPNVGSGGTASPPPQFRTPHVHRNVRPMSMRNFLDHALSGPEFSQLLATLFEQSAGPSGAPPASEQQIASMPDVEITDTLANAYSSCSICQEDFVSGQRGKKLPCDHMFHVQCLDQWLRVRATCPTCRYELNPSTDSNSNSSRRTDGGGSSGDGSSFAPSLATSNAPAPSSSNASSLDPPHPAGTGTSGSGHTSDAAPSALSQASTTATAAEAADSSGPRSPTRASVDTAAGVGACLGLHCLVVFSINGVSHSKGTFAHVEADFHVALDKDKVFEILVDPNNRQVFKNIVGVKYRRLLEKKGPDHEVYEISQVARWKFLVFSGTFDVKLLVDQDKTNYTLKFWLQQAGFMNKFNGSWSISDVPGYDRSVSQVLLEQSLQPALVPPPPLDGYA